MTAAHPGRKADAFSIAGKVSAPEEQVDVLVVGAGPAGQAAALEARARGSTVLLVDENPVPPSLMGLDAPLFYGGRWTGAAHNRSRMTEQIALNSGLEAAYEAGVEIRLGVSVWGAFLNGPGVSSLPGPAAGLADEDRSWLCGFKRLVVAAGARDLALAFKGWEQPGVMGAAALQSLLGRYDAFSGRRVLLMGSGELALKTALMALERGVEVVGLVEARDHPQGAKDDLDRLRAAGVEVFTGYAPEEAVGGLEGVERVVLASTIDPVRPRHEIACDTLCQAVGLVPVVDLLDSAGAQLAFDGARGGFTPILRANGETTRPGVFAVGDCAGVATDESYAMDWMRALTALADPSVVICQCEGVTRDALLGVRPPAYLGSLSPAMARRDLASLVRDGPPNQDQIKRLTRAGMGPCQGRRCREQIALLLSLASGSPLGSLPLAGYRAPVRPLPLKVLADLHEKAAMSEGWDVWFGIPSQWIPYQDIGGEREARHRAAALQADDG